jgi:hypothetical protein
MLSMPHTIHAQVDELFTEQTISGINTLTPSVSVHLCGDKLEGVDARSNRLYRHEKSLEELNLWIAR